MCNFITIANNFLENLAEKIENADKDFLLEIEYQDGILDIKDENNNNYVINSHDASQKIWYSSPFSGAYYFHLQNNYWQDDKNHILTELLGKELLDNYQIVIK